MPRVVSKFIRVVLFLSKCKDTKISDTG